MPVNAGVDTHAHGAANGLGNLALVDGAEARAVRVLDMAHARRKVGNQCVVL